jgi:hypothetical protein
MRPLSAVADDPRPKAALAPGFLAIIHAQVNPPYLLNPNNNEVIIMRSGLRVIVFALGAVAAQAVMAQVPAGAPAGSTGQCKDGSYTSNATKKGACRGHQGVKTWFAPETPATPAKAATAPAAPAPAPAAAAPAAPATAPARTTSHASGTPAPGGGPGLVWVNTSTNVYHCYGARYYGTTKAGKYMTEAQAKASGAHPQAGKACSQ